MTLTHRAIAASGCVTFSPLHVFNNNSENVWAATTTPENEYDVKLNGLSLRNCVVTEECECECVSVR